MPLIKVSIYSFLSILLWNTGITYVGNRLGYRWEELKGFLELYSKAAIAILSGIILLYIICQVALKLKNKKMI
jgi:membrane protein DedA with SNARE-associated domain